MARILITSGATREPVDEVRFISNLSTGSTGALLAEVFERLGHEVFLLHGQGAVLPQATIQTGSFGSARDLEEKLQQKLGLGTFDAVVMCAAVSDYRPELSHSGKLSSDETELNIRLVRNPKILPKLKQFSPRKLIVVGFKFTVNAGETSRLDAVRRQFATGGVDAVVHNDLTEIRSSPVHPFRLFRSPSTEPERLFGCTGLARQLSAFIEVREHS